MVQTKGVIYLAEKRSSSHSPYFKSLQTLPTPSIDVGYQAINHFSDHLLLGGQSYFPVIKQKNCLVLLPLTGAIEVHRQDKSEIIGAGEVAFLKIDKEEIQIENPYSDEAVNFLEIWIATDQYCDSNNQLTVFDIEQHTNQLISLSDNSLPFQLWIGKFEGRKEEAIFLEKRNKIFAFVIHGAFELQNRLLEGRDALLLWDCEAIEFEALANESILLLIAY